MARAKLCFHGDTNGDQESEREKERHRERERERKREKRSIRQKRVHEEHALGNVIDQS